MVAIDLSKQQALDPNPEAIQQINFTGNLSTINQQSFSLLSRIKKQL